MKYLFMLLIMTGCSAGNLAEVKLHAADVWSENGFKILGYQGYVRWLVVPFTSYGGACVWYTIQSKQNNGIIYDGCLQRWGDEYHVYNLKALDAIKP